jgi:hypothetical protein
MLPSIVLIYLNWSSSQNRAEFKTINGDGMDYYSYLTSAFITKDIQHLNTENQFVVETKTGNINLHPVGVALLQLPFFMIGYLSANISHANLDGYSLPFQLSISASALFYLLLGFWFIYKTLVNKGYTAIISVITIVSLFFGTTLINYAINEPAMSHVYSFSLIAMFVFFNQRFAKQYSSRDLFFIALIFGLIVLVRPINILVLLAVPFFYGSFADLKTRLNETISNKRNVLIATLIFLAVFSLQSIVWYIQTNEFFQYSYKGNGFYFSKPQVWNMLFGFNSGIAIYMPFFLLMSVALVILFKLNRYKAVSIFIFAGTSLYIYSSYWGWTYFDGIGTRVFVDYASIVALGFAGILNHLTSRKARVYIGAFTIVCIVYNMIICYQYKQGIIQACGMNFEKYKYVFLKTNAKYNNCLGGCYDIEPYSKEKKESILKYQNEFTNSKNDFYVYNRNEYGVEYRTEPLHLKTRKLHLKVNFDRLDFSSNPSNEALLAVSINNDKNDCKSFQAFKINDTPSISTLSNWKKYEYTVNIASPINETDNLCVFVWNKNKETFGIDNFKVEVFDYGTIN